jgi:YhcH/YjgK/YiaL family protein
LGEGQSKRIELSAGAYAMEQAYATKPRADGIFESHRKYIDLQVLLEGEEILEVIDLARVTVRQAYDAEKDYALYADHSGGSRLRLRAGEAAVFYPVDVHMPSLRSGDQPVRVRKTVVKIPVG